MKKPKNVLFRGINLFSCHHAVSIRVFLLTLVMLAMDLMILNYQVKSDLDKANTLIDTFQSHEKLALGTEFSGLTPDPRFIDGLGGEDENFSYDEISIIDQELFTDNVQPASQAQSGSKISSTIAKMKKGFDLAYGSFVEDNDWLAGLQLDSETIPSFVPVKVYSMTSGFGIRKSPFSNRKRLHRGIDLRASYGSPVYAAAAGRVISAGYHRSYGRMIIIDHGNGLESHYAHNSKVNVKEGQQIEKGQFIANIGMTGRTTGPHLHFEVWLHGRPVNPLKFLVIPSQNMAKDGTTPRDLMNFQSSNLGEIEQDNHD